MRYNYFDYAIFFNLSAYLMERKCGVYVYCMVMVYLMLCNVLVVSADHVIALL